MLARPQISLSEFAEIVGDPTRWPSNFEWYYPAGTTCAVGLFYEMFESLPTAFNLSFDEITELCARKYRRLGFLWEIDDRDVTHAMVARNIRRWVRKNGERFAYLPQHGTTYERLTGVQDHHMSVMRDWCESQIDQITGIENFRGGGDAQKEIR